MIVGIDLGTTNCAVAFAHPDGSGRIEDFAVPQLVRPGEVAARATLPSFLYLPGLHELPAGAAALPWDAGRTLLVGELARTQGALVPGRLVASAKSWLCHAGVDRSAAILPWDAPADVPKLSPVAVSACFLQHLREGKRPELWQDSLPPGPDKHITAMPALPLLPATLAVLSTRRSLWPLRRSSTVRTRGQAARGAAVSDTIDGRSIRKYSLTGMRISSWWVPPSNTISLLSASERSRYTSTP